MITIRMLCLFGLPVIMLGACRTPRKACERAQGHVNKAVMLCPDLLTQHQRTDTISLTVPGDAGAGQATYTQAEMDSVVSLCNMLVNRSLRHNTEKRKEHEAQRDALQLQVATAEQKLRALRAYVCRFDTVVVEDSLFSLRVWTSGNAIKYVYYVHPRTVSTAHTTTVPRVNLRDQPCPPVGVSDGWRLWCIILGMALLLTWLRRIAGLWASMKTWGALSLCLVLSTGTSAQADSLARAAERSWMRPATDGRLWHDLPPPANVVNAGAFITDAGNKGQTALWTAIACGTVGAVFHRHNADASRAIWAVGGGVSLYFLHRHNRSLRRGGALLQSGYRITQRYEVVPDSIAPGPYLRLTPLK